MSQLVQLIADDPSKAAFNTKCLQEAVDNAAAAEPIHKAPAAEPIHKAPAQLLLPKGRFFFASAGKACDYQDGRRQQTIAEHVILLHDGVTIVGQGRDTVLCPVGDTDEGLDMFYFNAFLDSKFRRREYLKDCHFRDFAIDSQKTSCRRYTTAGKGFMLNLCQDCTWENIQIYRTDGTGFGMDCTIRCRIANCYAEGCGKGASDQSGGGSGFGIGYGASDEESMEITSCEAVANRKFGFFFENQARFNPAYGASSHGEFLVRNCLASGNLYNFGGMLSENVVYDNCRGMSPREKDYFFGDRSRDNVIR